MTETCGHHIKTTSGETVTPCHLPPHTEGKHEGWCLGSITTWPYETEMGEELGEKPGSGWGPDV